MGHIGKLSRGLKWWLGNRDLDGVLKPEISEDADKMLNVNYYLNYIEGKDSEAVNLALHKMFLLRHAPGGVKSKLFRDVKKQLEEGNFPVKEQTKSKVKK